MDLGYFICVKIDSIMHIYDLKKNFREKTNKNSINFFIIKNLMAPSHLKNLKHNNNCKLVVTSPS